MQGAESLVALHCQVRVPGRRSSAIYVHGDHRVYGPVDGFDPLQTVFQQFRGRDLTVSDGAAQRGCVVVAQWDLGSQLGLDQSFLPACFDSRSIGGLSQLGAPNAFDMVARSVDSLPRW